MIAQHLEMFVRLMMPSSAPFVISSIDSANGMKCCCIVQRPLVVCE
jgi:ABC-type nitrate/sulfonate/bicarbonate transport system permease component